MPVVELKTLASTVEGLIQAASQLSADAPSGDYLAGIIERGEFRPLENEAIGYWFARYLTIRESLWSVIDDGRQAMDDPSLTDKDERLRYFLVGYAAACVLVGIDRVMLFDVAKHTIVQRKLNEPFQELRIPRKQYTRVFEAFIHEKSAWSLLAAMKYAKKNRRRLAALRQDPVTGAIAARLPELQKSLDPSKREYFKGAWAFVSHKWRRRGVVSANNVLSGVVEGVGRLASDIHLTNTKQVTDDTRRSIGEFLKPGDITVTRHATAVTNLFMPGFWPHAALHIGTEEQRAKIGVQMDSGRKAKAADPVRFLEARKDGVLLRPLEDTLSVDCCTVLRPQLTPKELANALTTAITHEGKQYDFEFDFRRADKLVCTEVVYRSFHGVGDIQFELSPKAGRMCLPAESLIDLAIEGVIFKPVCVYGVRGNRFCGDEESARAALISTRNAD